MMNFMSMEYFIIVVHYRNITRAAAHLHITQQTLSAHMSALEKRAGLSAADPPHTVATDL